MTQKIRTIWSVTEWGKLREIIIGDPTQAFVPDLSDISMRSFDRPDEETIQLQVRQSMPSHVMSESAEDIAELTSALRHFGATVHQAAAQNFTTPITSPFWELDQESGINIRDLTFIHGNLIIDAPSPTRNRIFESCNVRHFWNDYASRDPESWFVSAPKPQLLDHNYDFENETGLREVEPLFDAANCVRLGRDVIIDLNNTANRLGADWLQRSLDAHYGGRTVTVHRLQKCSPDHIDVVLIPLCEGVFLTNPTYIRPEHIPEKFKSWEIITALDMVGQSFSIGSPKASDWIGLNVLVLDGERKQVVVEKRQLPLIKLLESRGFDVLPLSWRHGRTWGGAFHCVTLDVHRDGTL